MPPALLMVLVVFLFVTVNGKCVSQFFKEARLESSHLHVAVIISNVVNHGVREQITCRRNRRLSNANRERPYLLESWTVLEVGATAEGHISRRQRAEPPPCASTNGLALNRGV